MCRIVVLAIFTSRESSSKAGKQDKKISFLISHEASNFVLIRDDKLFPFSLFIVVGVFFVAMLRL